MSQKLQFSTKKNIFNVLIMLFNETSSKSHQECSNKTQFISEKIVLKNCLPTIRFNIYLKAHISNLDVFDIY